MEAAVRLGLHLVVIILPDNAYGMINGKRANMGWADYGLDYGNPDIVQYANSDGARGYRVASAGEMLPLLRQCHAEAAVQVIELDVDCSDYDRILNHEIIERSAEVKR